MILIWREDIEDSKDKIEYWSIANLERRKYMVYSFLEPELMNAQIECSIIKENKIGNQIIYFTREDETGLPGFLSEWLGKMIKIQKNNLEEIAEQFNKRWNQ